MDRILFLFAVLFLIWIVLHITDRRRIINGFFFFISIFSLLLLMLYIGENYNIQVLTFISVILISLIIAIVPIVYVYSVYLLFTSGIELIKKEGLSLSHLLSFAFGLAIVLSAVVAPFIINKINSKVILFIINFFLSSFTYFVLGFIIYLCSAIIYNFYIERYDKDYLIVLGAGLNKDKVTPLLAGRIDKAIDFYNKQKEKNSKDLKIIMSGGKGSDEIISEALAMKNYAMTNGINMEDIILEDRSTSTYENLKFSSEIIGNSRSKVLFFTSDYHVFRASLLSKKLGLSYNGKGSKVKLYYSISAFIREYIGVLYINRKINIVICLLFSIISAISNIN